MSSYSRTEQGNSVGPGTEGADDNAQASSEDVEDAPTGEESDGGLSRDLVFDALKNSRRRQVLRYLDERGERVRLGELAEHVAAIENDTTTAALDSDQRKRVYVGLYQSHLPRLDDMNIVEFNQSRGHVELGPKAVHLKRHLYIDEGGDRSRYPYYAAFGAASTMIVLAGVLTGSVGAAGAVAVLAMQGIAAITLATVHAFHRPNERA